MSDENAPDGLKQLVILKVGQSGGKVKIKAKKLES